MPESQSSNCEVEDKICGELLITGLEALRLPINGDKIEKLLAFTALIDKWNKVYNLTAIRQQAEMVGLHLLDSLAILPYLQGNRIVDVGTGAGLPGIPLALYAPERQFVLLDSNQKKTRFVRQAVLELRLQNVVVHHGRAEDYRPQQLFDTVLARAFAEVPGIWRTTRHLLGRHGIVLAMKGQDPDAELRQLHVDYAVYSLQVPGIGAKRCLVQINQV